MQPAAEPPTAPRRHRRTALLIAVAAGLGAIAGICTGYVVQAGQDPTPLPPLSQPVIRQAKTGAEPLSAAADRRVKTDGDLRKLLLRKPSGARAAENLQGDDGWLDMAAYAKAYDHPDDEFGHLIETEFRRAAVTGWTSGSTSVEVRLIQYRQEETLGARAATKNNQYWKEAEPGTRTLPVPGTTDGQAYVRSRPDSGVDRAYGAEAYAWRGDIAVEIFVRDSKPVSGAKVVDLAERQMERL
ncbi:hypothetical protein H1R13_11995 [Streptomyces mexicanus]|uniref:Uncharacterized protein n=1 Tax=Streptomyces mexicanus TaxID=178566 RepID=A0A7X1HZU2_9ACTN|nr:hypothetical protein [Streptomyces mexicanus]